MTRPNLFLVIAIILSAMFLVHSHYEARRSFMILEAAMKETTRLELEHERLQVERRSQASPLRIEQIAKQQLQMRLVTPGITQYVKQPADLQTSSQKVAAQKPEKSTEVKP
ncbi:MAG: cell division protein FtsL [Burkholderiales bacterium]